MGRAAALKAKRREIRRELRRQLNNPQLHREVEKYMSAMRTEAFYISFRLIEDGLRELFGFGDKRIGRLLGYVKGRAIFDGYFEKGLPLEEITYNK